MSQSHSFIYHFLNFLPFHLPSPASARRAQRGFTLGCMEITLLPPYLSTICMYVCRATTLCHIRRFTSAASVPPIPPSREHLCFLSVFLSFHHSVCLSVCLPAFLSFCLSVFLSLTLCLAAYLSIHPFISLSIHLYVYLSSLSICPSIYLIFLSLCSFYPLFFSTFH